MISVHAESPTTAAPSLRAVLQDFAREADPSAQLVSLSLKRFATLIFGTCPGLGPYSGALDAIYKQFNDYKQVGYVSFERSLHVPGGSRPRKRSCSARSMLHGFES